MTANVAKQLMLFIFLFCTPLFRNHIFAQENQNCKKAKALINLMEKRHFAPPPFNDSRSAYIFEETFQLLDPKGLYFTEEGIASLSEFKFDLDDDLQKANCRFIQQLTQSYKLSLQKADSLVQDILKSSLKLEEKDSLQLYFSSRTSYSKDPQNLQKRWKKHLKYEVLLNIIGESENSSSLTPSMVKKEVPQALQLAVQKARCNIQKIMDHPEGIENYVVSNLLNAITTAYDPHSAFFSLEDKEEFLTSLSKDSYSYGLDVAEDNTGSIRISRLIPGGPAWHSNELHEGDYLLKAKLNDKKSIHFNCLSGWEAEKLLTSFTADPVAFTVRKKDGRVLTVELAKEKLEVEENIINSFVLTGDKKIGYLALPGFYTDWNDNNPLGCANDMAKEILKLKKERVEGLILDLRFNGGGSITEALNLAGMFIDQGPLGLMANREEKPVILKDMNRGTIYDDPLLVLVNGLSASASELIAAVLQDYNRAIIVGSPTFGKASAQEIVALDGAPVYYGKKKNSQDYVKITNGKLYRITGATHQGQGVVPDIKLPDILDYFPYRESTYTTALAADEINKKVYYTHLPPLKLKEVSSRSQARVATNPGFVNIITTSEELKQIAENGKTVKLDIHSFLEDSKSASPDTLESEKAVSSFKITNTILSQEVMQMDQQKKFMNDKLIEHLSHDIHLEEAFYILGDLISINQK